MEMKCPSQPSTQTPSNSKNVIVYREDRRAIKRLGGMSAMLRYSVGEWVKKGRGRFMKYVPLSWYVPEEALPGVTVIDESAARSIRSRRSESGRKAHLTLKTRVVEKALEIGLGVRSRLAYQALYGDENPDDVELSAFKIAWRHEHTDYDQLLRSGVERDIARDIMQDSFSSDDWQKYLDHYGFASKVAEALANVLKSPRACHPTWLKEAEIAVRRAGLDLGSLTYEGISAAISNWRSQRHEDRYG